MKRREWKIEGLIVCMVLLVMLGVPGRSFSQQYPNKPINFLVAVGLGGTADISARMLGDSAAKSLGQPMIVSNNGGGGGSVGLALLANEKPDGYHILFCSNQPLTIIPQQRRVPYKLSDFVPVMQMASQQAGLVVRADAPWKTFKELVDYAKKNPAKVTYAVSGTYMATHLAMMYVARQEGIEWTAIPVTSDPNMPLLGGHVTAYSGSTAWAPYVRSGKFRLLAVHGEKRMKSFPDVPTFRELGYDFVGGFESYIMAPNGTPPTVVKTLETALKKAMDTPEFIQYSEKVENDPTFRSSEDARKYLEAQYARFSKLFMEFKIPKESDSK